MKKMSFLISSVLLMSAVPLAQAAGTLQGNLGVKITIGDGCTINNADTSDGSNNFGNIDFGSHPSLSNIIDGQSTGTNGNLSIECSNGSAYSIALDSGQHANANQRRMSGGTNEFVEYNLYKDSARANLWGDGSNGGTARTSTGTGKSQSLIVFGRVPVQSTPSPSVYTDTVMVTVTW